MTDRTQEQIYEDIRTTQPPTYPTGLGADKLAAAVAAVAYWQRVKALWDELTDVLPQHSGPLPVWAFAAVLGASSHALERQLEEEERVARLRERAERLSSS